LVLGFDLNGDDELDTVLETLSYKGGNGVEGAQRILLRAYTAAFLNQQAFGAAYSGDFSGIWTVFDSGDRQAMLDLASELDEANIAGCPF
jgi:hypothetical protein